MKPETHRQDPPEPVPRELLRALAKLQAGPVEVAPETEAAILQAAREHFSKPGPRVVRRICWPLAAAACIALVFTFSRRSQPSPEAAPQLAKQEEDAAAIILREVSALFPHQVRAIVKDSSGLRFSLSDKPDVQPGPALVLKVCEPAGCEEIITFGGQQIDVAGHQVIVGTEAGGGVTLSGETLLWSSESGDSSAPDLSIIARRF